MITQKEASRISSLMVSLVICECIQNEWETKAKQHEQGSHQYNSYNRLAFDTWHDKLIAELALLEEFGISMYYKDSIKARTEEVKRLIVIARGSLERLVA